MKLFVGIRNGLLIELVALLALTACPSRVHAQSPATVYVIGSSLDTISTVVALRQSNVQEGNPVLSHGGTVGFVASKVAITAATAWLIHRIALQHPRFAKVMGYGGGIALGGVAVHNVRLSAQ